MSRPQVIAAGLFLTASLIVLLYSVRRDDDLRARGLLELRSGNLAAAESCLEAYLLTHPDDVLCRKQLAESYWLSGNLDRALHHRLVIARKSDDPDRAMRTLAAEAVNARESQLAEAALKELLLGHPNDFAANLALGELYHGLGQNADAIPFIERCITARPDRFESYLLLADVLSDAGRSQEMIGPLEKCISISPENLTAHSNLAYAFQAAGRSEDAIKSARWCLARDPSLSRVRLVLAQALRDKGHHDAALETVQRVQQQEPENLDAMLIESEIKLFRGDRDSVYEKLTGYYEANKYDRRLVTHLMRAAAVNGDRENAKKWQRKLSELIPEPSKDSPQLTGQQ
jgi:tetratricopeptide (TPR) repeat protein